MKMRTYQFGRKCSGRGNVFDDPVPNARLLLCGDPVPNVRVEVMDIYVDTHTTLYIRFVYDKLAQGNSRM